MDTFAKDRLPPKELWPRIHFDLPELQYPAKLNCGAVLLDDAVAEGHGERPAILADTGTITYRELLERANRIANVLTDAGVVPGNRVLLRGYNGPELYSAWLAVMKTGAIAVTTMPMLRAPELTAVIGKAKPVVALSDHRLLGELAGVAAAGGVGTVIAWGNGDLEGRTRKLPIDSPTRIPRRTTSASWHSPRARPASPRPASFPPGRARDGGRRREASPEDRPGRRLRGQPAARLHLRPRRASGVSASFPRGDRADRGAGAGGRARRIEKHRVTCLFTAPFAYRALAARARGPRLSSLRHCVSAGEFLPKSVSDPGSRRPESASSTGSARRNDPHLHFRRRRRHPSRFDRQTLARIQGLPAGRGRQECCRARPAAGGDRATGCRYLDDERQRDYVQNGWNVTGDLYRLDEDGYFWFVARADDMIVSAGYNIAGPKSSGPCSRIRPSANARSSARRIPSAGRS